MENVNASNRGQYLVNEEVKTNIGDNMAQAQEPTQKVETTSKAEDTALKNEEKRPEANMETQKAEEGGDSKQNASNVINELGESRKKVLEKVIESAKKSGVAADELKELIAQDKSLEKTIKSKFGNDYDALMRGEFDKPEKQESEEEQKASFEKLKRKATLEAKLEVMKEEDQRIKNKQIEVFAEANGLNTDEVEALKENAELLSEKYGYEESLSKALLLVNRDKSDTSKAFVPPSGSNDKPTSGVSKNDPIMNTYRKHMPSRDLAQVQKNIDQVNTRIKKDDRGGESFTVSL